MGIGATKKFLFLTNFRTIKIGLKQHLWSSIPEIQDSKLLYGIAAINVMARNTSFKIGKGGKYTYHRVETYSV